MYRVETIVRTLNVKEVKKSHLAALGATSRPRAMEQCPPTIVIICLGVAASPPENAIQKKTLTGSMGY
jgi:hypothetical protein